MIQTTFVSAEEYQKIPDFESPFYQIKGDSNNIYLGFPDEDDFPF